MNQTNPPLDNSATLPSPPLWRHLMAMLYDTLLVLPLFMAAAALWVAILGPTDSVEVPAVPAALQWISWSVILCLFFGIFWRRAGQTLGMQAWRIKLVNETPSAITWRQTTIRVIGAALSAAMLGAGYLWRYVPADERYWHDHLSRTRLVLIPKAQ